MKVSRVVLAAATLLLLTGCVAASPLELGEEAGRITIVLCDDVTADRIVASRFGPKADGFTPEEVVWEVAGDSQNFGRGDTVVIGRVPDGFETVIGYDAESVDSTGDLLLIAFERIGAGSDVATYDLAKVADGSWVDAEGRVSSERCSS